MSFLALLSKAVRLRNFKAAWIGALAGIALTVASGLLLFSDGGGAFARLSYDLPFMIERGVPVEVIMVYIDSAVKRNLGQPTDLPLDRRFHARLLEKLQKAETKLVLYDLLLDTPSSDPQADREFAAAIRAHGRVVLVANYDKELQSNAILDVEIPPIPILSEAAAGIGLARIAPDPTADPHSSADSEGRYIRRFDPGTESNPSASWVAGSLLGAPVTKDERHRLDLRWLHYYCAPLEYRSVSLDTALTDAPTMREYFRGKIVVVGVSDNPDDTFRTPHSRLGSGLLFQGPTAPGAAIQATSLLNLVRGDWLTRLGVKKEIAIIIVWGILTSILLMLLRPWFAIGAALVLVLLLIAVSSLLPIHEHIWYAWTIPAMVQTPMALIWGVGYQYIVEARRSRLIQRALGLYYSPKLVKRIAKREIDLSLGGKEEEATVMFTDLAGFTSMSEPLSPTEVSRMLTNYFTRTSKAIKDMDGMLIKYLGDGVMAGWGAPEPDPQHAEHAVLAALTIVRAGKEQSHGPPLRTRIGINTGIFLAGNLGSEDRFDYTLFGDATNFASRLEGLNKFLGTDILISEATFKQLKDGIQTRPVGRFIVVGKGKPSAVYEVLGRSEDFQPAPPWLDTFARGLEHFARHELDTAEKMFRETIERRRSDDGPSQFYLQRIERERTKPDTSVWDGTVRLQEK